MREMISIALAAIVISLCPSCTLPKYDPACETFTYVEGSENVAIKMELYLPVAENGPARTVRNTLLSMFVRQMESFGFDEAEPLSLEPYTGDGNDLNAVVGHYGKAMLSCLDAIAAGDRADRLENSDFAPMWEYDASIGMSVETDRYVVFNSSDYIYLGGAHGGVAGAGNLTFRKSDGSLCRVIDRSKVDKMQDLIREGLLVFVTEEGDGPESMDYFFTEDGSFPLPVWDPSLSEEGVVFTYQQYEVAPYAFGMPSFTVPYDKISAFMTPEARKLAHL